MKKQTITCALWLLLGLSAQISAQKLTIAPVVGTDVSMEMQMKIGNSTVKVLPPVRFAAGAQAKYQFNDRFSTHLLANAAFGRGEWAGTSLQTLDFQLEPQAEYRFSKIGSVFMGLQNRFNNNEWLKSGNDWQSLKSVSNPVVSVPPTDFRIFDAYELRARIGIRGYYNNLFVDLSYYHALTSSFNNIEFTDEIGQPVTLGKVYTNGFGLAIGYFLGGEKEAKK